MLLTMTDDGLLWIKPIQDIFDKRITTVGSTWNIDSAGNRKENTLVTSLAFSYDKARDCGLGILVTL
jgi:hypothetical protein